MIPVFDTRSQTQHSKASFVLDELKQWYSTTSENRLKIQRVSGEALPIESCYINLAIIESQPEKAQDKESSKQSFFHLTGSERIAKTSLENPIILANLFRSRQLKNGIEGIPKRILVKGRAGVGKTTLAKKIVHDHLHHGLWKKHFDWVLWIPLHRLKSKPRNYSFEMFLQDEYFKGNLYDAARAAELYQSIQKTPSRALLILDGWDEIKRENPTDCLRTLVNHPSILVTTRPPRSASNEIAFLDLELETVGFSADNVKKYLNHSSIVEPTVGQAIQAFVQHNDFVQELVNIPIQLDALCFSWDEIKSDDPTPTMTALYKAITRALWRKDTINLGKQTAMGMTERQATTTRQFSVIEEQIQSEQQCLGALALNRLNNNQIKFNATDLETAVIQVAPHNVNLYDTMNQLSFLQVEREVGSRTRLSYQFLHLTFQKYFAAQWLVHCLKTNNPLQFQQKPISVEAFIHQEKYNPRYEIVWRFVAGLLDPEELRAFFDLLDGGPKDLIGIQHQMLLMNCLSESNDRLPRDRRARIEFTLYDWFVFEIGQPIHDNGFYISRLGRQAAFPERLLLKQLKDSECSDKIKGIIARTLGARSIVSDNAVQALTVLAADADWGVRKHAAEALGQCASSSSKAVEALLLLANDANLEMRKDAALALGQCASASPEALEALITLAGDDKYPQVQVIAVKALDQCASAPLKSSAPMIALANNEYLKLRMISAKVVGKEASASPEALEALITLAGHNDNLQILEIAALALGQIARESPTALKALIKFSKNRLFEVRKITAEALGQCADVSSKALNILITFITEDKSVKVRRAAAETLGQCPDVALKASDTLIALAKHDSWQMRAIAATSLGQCARVLPTVVKDLIVLAKDSEFMVRENAAKALGQCVSISPKAVDTLIVLTQDEDWRVRRNAVEAFSQCASASPKVVDALMALTQDQNLTVRMNATKALGQSACVSPEVVKALIALAKDAHIDVRQNAVLALSQCANALPEALKALIELAEDEHRWIWECAAGALGCVCIPPEAVDDLSSLTENQHWVVRANAANTLGKVVGVSFQAVMVLIELVTKDTSRWVRKSAADALGEKLLWNIYPLLPAIDESLLATLYQYCLIPANFKQIVPLYLQANRLCFCTPEGLNTITLDNQKADAFRQAILKAQQAVGISLASQINQSVDDMTIRVVIPRWPSQYERSRDHDGLDSPTNLPIIKRMRQF